MATYNKTVEQDFIKWFNTTSKQSYDEAPDKAKTTAYQYYLKSIAGTLPEVKKVELDPTVYSRLDAYKDKTAVTSAETVGKEETKTAVPAPTATASNPYEGMLTSLNQSYDAAKSNALRTKEDTISAAYTEYLKKTQPYGVEAENLAAAGMSNMGGYGQLAKSNRFNAYANQEAYANNAYQKALTDIDLSKSAAEADLKYQQYKDDMTAAQNAYTQKANEANLFSVAQQKATDLARGLWNGRTNKNRANIDEIMTAIKKDPSITAYLNDDYITSIINSVLASK